MNPTASLDRRDRWLLLGCGGVLAVLFVLIGFLSPATSDDDPTPSIDSTAPHGARAAFELLKRSGYRVERQVGPLERVVADEHTTIIFAQPYSRNVDAARDAVKAILDKGGRVLVTGMGALLAPDNALQQTDLQWQGACNASPNGFSHLANSGAIRLTPEAQWRQTNPLHDVAYTCQGQAVVVTYSVGKGTVVWWANSSPLENSEIRQADNVVFFLRSLGPKESTRVLWDESLHGEAPSAWASTRGTPLKWIAWQLVLIAGLLILSFGRRGAPVRPDPAVARATQIEFVQSLGSLYQAANATQTAVGGAYQVFRQRLQQVFAIPQTVAADAPQLEAALLRNLAEGGARLQQTMLACELAMAADKLSSKKALSLVQTLHDDNADLQQPIKRTIS